MSNSFLSASSIPGGLLPSPSANLFERSIGTLLSTFKYSVADPINTDTNNVRTYQQPYQQAPQYQYSQTAPMNNMVMGPTGPIPNTTGIIPMSNNHKSVKKSTLYGEMMAVKLEKENKAGGNLALPSSTTYTNINLSAQAPNVPSQNFTNENNIKPAVTASSTTNNNTFQIPPPVNQSQITLHSNYPAPPQPPSVIITPQNNQQIQNVTVQDPVTGTFQNISYQQPTNISIGSNYPQQSVNKVNPSPTNNTQGITTAQSIYPPPIQVPSIQQNVNATNFQAPAQPQQPQIPSQQGQRTQYAPMTQLSNSVSNSSSSQQPMPNQKMEENTNLLSNHLQQNCAPTLNYIVGVFMDSIDSMQQNIDFFQSGTTGYTKNNDGSINAPKINYHPNMLTLFNDGLMDNNTNKSYGVNNKDESKLINEYFNWDLLSDTEKATTQKTQVTGNTSEFQQPPQQNQPVSLFNGIVPTQTVNIQQGQPQTLQLQPQQITVNGQPSQNIQLQSQIQPQQISIANPGRPQTIAVPGQSQTPQIQIQVPTPQLQNQSLPIQQINVQNQPLTITSQQTPQLQTQNIQTSSTGTATAQPQGAIQQQQQQQQQQPMVVMVEQGTNYQTTLYPSQNTINQNFVGQTAVAAPQQQTFNTFNQSPPAQTQFNTFNGQQPQPQQQSTQINYTITQTSQQPNQQAIPSAPSNPIDQPQTSQSLIFKGDTQDITRMTRVENTTTTNNNNNVQFYQGFENSNNPSVQNIQPSSNIQFTNDNTNSGQLQDNKLINKSLDNLNSTSTSVTISNTNGTITDTANSNATTVDSVATNTSTIVKPKRKERPSTKPKPFKCPTCQQTFSRSHDLKRHMYTHTGIKPFKCEKCGKSFSRRDALNRHSKGEINCIRYLNKLNNMKKQQNKAKQQEAKVQQ